MEYVVIKEVYDDDFITYEKDIPRLLPAYYPAEVEFVSSYRDGIEKFPGFPVLALPEYKQYLNAMNKLIIDNVVLRKEEIKRPWWKFWGKRG